MARQKGEIDGLAIAMLLSLKETALSADLGDDTERMLSKACGGCGMYVIARDIDGIITALLNYQTRSADYRFRYELADRINRQWSDLGFQEDPEDMDPEKIEELKEIAKKYYPDDDD